MAVAEKGDLPSELEILFRVEQVEARGRRAGEHVLAESHQERTLELRGPIFVESRDVKLHDRAGAAVGRGERFIAAGADVTIEPRFAVAEDRARCVARRRLHRMVEPRAITRRNQDFRINAAESLGIGVVDQALETFVAHRAALSTSRNGKVDSPGGYTRGK